MALLIAFFIVFLTTLGQILLKKAALTHENRKKSLLFLVLGYSIFVITIGLSYLLMKMIPMKYFTVIMSLNYITVMLGAKLFLNERLNRQKIIGTSLVAIGILIFMWR